jgi:hypothetical protein
MAGVWGLFLTILELLDLPLESSFVVKTRAFKFGDLHGQP